MLKAVANSGEKADARDLLFNARDLRALLRGSAAVLAGLRRRFGLLDQRGGRLVQNARNVYYPMIGSVELGDDAAPGVVLLHIAACGLT
jgi:hypothetical protein